MALVLFGQLSLAGVDVSDEVTSFTLMASRNEVAVPASLGNKVEYVKAGSEKWQIEIAYRQSEATNSVSKIFYDALLTEAATVNFSGSITDDTDSDNFYGTFVVSGLSHGGAADSLAEDSQTFTLTARPVRTAGGS
ncbi:MAG: hypothetical protein QOE09_372 [Ilumatobacteraceae bacterium]|jgi:hypothetical protein